MSTIASSSTQKGQLCFGEQLGSPHEHLPADPWQQEGVWCRILNSSNPSFARSGHGMGWGSISSLSQHRGAGCLPWHSRSGCWCSAHWCPRCSGHCRRCGCCRCCPRCPRCSCLLLLGASREPVSSSPESGVTPGTDVPSKDPCANTLMPLSSHEIPPATDNASVPSRLPACTTQTE